MHEIKLGCAALKQGVFQYLEHLLYLLSRQVDVELVQELQDLTDAQAAITILISFSEGLLQPCDGTLCSGKSTQNIRDIAAFDETPMQTETPGVKIHIE